MDAYCCKRLIRNGNMCAFGELVRVGVLRQCEYIVHCRCDLHTCNHIRNPPIFIKMSLIYVNIYIYIHFCNYIRTVNVLITYTAF